MKVYFYMRGLIQDGYSKNTEFSIKNAVIRKKKDSSS